MNFPLFGENPSNLEGFSPFGQCYNYRFHACTAYSNWSLKKPQFEYCQQSFPFNLIHRTQALLLTHWRIKYYQFRAVVSLVPVREKQTANQVFFHILNSTRIWVKKYDFTKRLPIQTFKFYSTPYRILKFYWRALCGVKKRINPILSKLSANCTETSINIGEHFRFVLEQIQCSSEIRQQ